jgi:uncharacterized protein DUF3558
MTREARSCRRRACSRRAPFTVVLGICMAAVVTAGCAGPSTSELPSTPALSSPNDYGAPRVTKPLDGSPFFTKPCAVLTAEQLRAQNLPAMGTSDTDGPLARWVGPSCGWDNVSAQDGIGFGFLSENLNGLSDTYRARDRFEGYFEPTDVDGYPAVFNDPGDFRAKGSCNITVGISDTLAFITNVDEAYSGRKSCDRAKRNASLIVKNIATGAG